MFSLFEQLCHAPIPLERRSPERQNSKARHRMTPEELNAWTTQHRAKRRAYENEYRKRIRANKKGAK